VRRLKVKADQAVGKKKRDVEEAMKKAIRDYRLSTDYFC